MKDEEKLKEARLQVTDERNIRLNLCALRMAALRASDCNVFCLSFCRMYDPMISKLMSCMICLFCRLMQLHGEY